MAAKDSNKNTAESIWAHFGPYYAMFPLSFAFNVIKRYSKKGDVVLDPFAGRFTSIYAGSVLNRKSIGIEINPVGGPCISINQEIDGTNITPEQIIYEPDGEYFEISALRNE